MRSNITFRLLELFTAVARAGSFTAAARDLVISESSVSRGIRDLERHLGTEVFTRDTRNVVLTKAGRELESIASTILSSREEGLRRFERFMAGRQGVLSIATLPSVAATLLPDLIVRFRAECPAAELRIHDDLDAGVRARVRSGSADLGITAAPETPLDQDLEIVPLVNDLMHAICPLDHVWRTRDRVSWVDLVQEQFIALDGESSIRRITDRSFHLMQMMPPTYIEASNVATVVGLVSAGLGVSVLPSLVLNMVRIEHVLVRPLAEPSLTRSVALILPVGTELSPVARRFIDIASNRLRPDEGLPMSRDALRLANSPPS